jgi:hypothetical protein
VSNYHFRGTPFVGEYNATTGATINAKFIITGIGPNAAFAPSGLALLGNTLFVANFGSGAGNGTVGTYDATTGAAISNFITGLTFPQGIAVKIANQDQQGQNQDP